MPSGDIFRIFCDEFVQKLRQSISPDIPSRVSFKGFKKKFLDDCQKELREDS